MKDYVNSNCKSLVSKRGLKIRSFWHLLSEQRGQKFYYSRNLFKMSFYLLLSNVNMKFETGWHTEADNITGCKLLKFTVGHPIHNSFLFFTIHQNSCFLKFLSQMLGERILLSRLKESIIKYKYK